MNDAPASKTIVMPPAPGVAAGIDEAMIDQVVRTFYGHIRADPMLGPIFSAAISDWEPHLVKMCDFWSSMLLMTRRYDGRPVPAHVRIEGLGPAHFARWLEMFAMTVNTICPGAAADLFLDRAQRVAQSLQLSIDFHRGVLPPLKAPIRAGTVRGSNRQ